MPVVQRRRPQAPVLPRGSPGRPVLLATLDVPFDRDAVVFAVDSAVEQGARLIVANVVEWAPLPLSAIMGYDELPYTPEMAESLAEPVRLARSLGVEVTRLRVKSLHPIPALLELSPSRIRGCSFSARTAGGSCGCATGGPPARSGPASRR
jgi:hypothetical protein